MLCGKIYNRLSSFYTACGWIHLEKKEKKYLRHSCNFQFVVSFYASASKGAGGIMFSGCLSIRQYTLDLVSTV